MKFIGLFFILLLLLAGICPAQQVRSTGVNRRVTTEIPHYEMTVKIAPDAHRLAASGTLILPTADEPRPSFSLVLSEVMEDFEVEILEPQTSAGMTKMQKKSVEAGSVTWTIEPPKPVPAKASVKLKFSFAGGEKIASVFYIGAEGSFAGGNSTAWFPQIERDPRSTGTIDFNVPAGYTVVAPGKQISPPEQTARGGFKFSIAHPSYFTFAAARYTIVRRSSTDGIQMSAYLLRPRTNINHFFEGYSKVLNVLIKEFGANPFGSGFSIVEVPTEQAGQAGFEGASGEGFFFSNGNFLDADFNTAYYGHEIAHQWWGVAVGRKWWEDDGRGRLLLDEALAQYGSVRSVEEIEGARAAERYRRDGYPGYIDFHSASGYFMIASGGLDSPLVQLSRNPADRILADSKGFIVYDMLSRTLGRENFRRILHSIARKYAFKNISFDEFLSEIETGAKRDLKWFYAQWLERDGAPEFQLNWVQEEKTNLVRGTITQPATPYYRTSLEIQIEGDNQTLIKSLEVSGGKTAFIFPVNYRVRSVTLDPNFKILRWTPEYLALKPALRAYLLSNIEREQGNLDRAESLLKDALAKQNDPDLYGSRFLLEMGLGQFYLGQNKFQEAKTYLERAVANPARRANVLPWAYFYLARAAQGLNDKEALRRAVKAAITADAAFGGRTGVTREAHALLNN